MVVVFEYFQSRMLEGENGERRGRGKREGGRRRGKEGGGGAKGRGCDEGKETHGDAAIVFPPQSGVLGVARRGRRRNLWCPLLSRFFGPRPGVATRCRARVNLWLGCRQVSLRSRRLRIGIWARGVTFGFVLLRFLCFVHYFLHTPKFLVGCSFSLVVVSRWLYVS